MMDVIVVGAGASGVNAAYPLVESGLKVLLLDVGNEDPVYENIIPKKGFTDLRKTDENQHRYFLGDNFEGIPFGTVQVGAQLTPPRLHITRDTETLIPLESSNYSTSESLATGGLGAGWGAAVGPFQEEDLKEFPINFSDLQPHYEIIAERIGVSGERDDTLGFYGDCKSLQPSPDLDSNGEILLSRYLKKRKTLNEKGFYMGKARLAICGQPHRGREENQGYDMEFWGDLDRSVYRPQWTLEELKKFENFHYLPKRFVLSFKENDSEVEVKTQVYKTKNEEIYKAKSLVLAGGALSTARIVLRSLNKYNKKIPLLCNPYTYVPVINFGMIGIDPKEKRHSLSQVTGLYRTPENRVVQSQFYSYRSLLTFKLMKESFLPFRESLKLMKLLTPLFGIIGIHHADKILDSKFCMLKKSLEGKPDILEVNYQLPPSEEKIQRKHEKDIGRFFRKLGCYPLKVIHPGYGASIHNGGTIPMREDEKELSCDPQCKLRGTKSVYLADGSVFPYLSAKGLTFTMMANANRVGSLLSKKLK